MSVRRILACLIVAVSSVAAAEARAECVDPFSCICPLASGLNTTFSGTIVQGMAGSEVVEVRVDVLNLIGTWTTLAAGGIVSLAVTPGMGPVGVGARIIGVSRTSCSTSSPTCEPAAGGETLSLKQIAAGDTSFACGGAKLSATADSLAATMASSGCFTEVQRLLTDAGVDQTCGDGDPGAACSVQRGPAPSGGWIAALGIAALIGLRRARRRSVTAS